MTFMEKIRWAAKTVAAIVGGLFTFITVVIAVTDDGSISGEEYGVLGGAVVTLVGTCIAVFKTTNRDPA